MRNQRPNGEISHNSTFWLELGAIAVVLRFLDEARSPFRRVRFHIIEASPIMERFPMSSKLNNYPPLLEYLFNLGRVLGSRKIERRSVSARRWTYSGCCLGVFGTISECCRLLASPLDYGAQLKLQPGSSTVSFRRDLCSASAEPGQYYQTHVGSSWR
jgi:hypothetical protein